jgi:serine/threonine-protein kinase RsbW
VQGQSVEIRIPASPDHVALLRALVGMYAAREDFTLEEVDDLRMAVEEAAVQLLRRVNGDRLGLVLRTDGTAVRARLFGGVDTDEPVMDRESFSWTILSALSDELRVDTVEGTAVVELTKIRGRDESA